MDRSQLLRALKAQLAIQPKPKHRKPRVEQLREAYAREEAKLAHIPATLHHNLRCKAERLTGVESPLDYLPLPTDDERYGKVSTDRPINMKRAAKRMQQGFIWRGRVLLDLTAYATMSME